MTKQPARLEAEENPMGMAGLGGMPPQSPVTTGRIPPMPKPDPQQQKYLNLVRELTEASSILVVKVATCKCKDKESCKLFHQAQLIADKIEHLQEIGKEGTKSGKSR